MNSRRLTGWPLRLLLYHAVSCIVHHGKVWVPMSALGQKQTLQSLRPMSAIPPKADIDRYECYVRFVPKTDICGAANLLRQVLTNHCQQFARAVGLGDVGVATGGMSFAVVAAQGIGSYGDNRNIF